MSTESALSSLQRWRVEGESPQVLHVGRDCKWKVFTRFTESLQKPSCFCFLTVLHGYMELLSESFQHLQTIFTHIKAQVNPSRYFQLGFGCCSDKICSFEKAPGFKMVPIKIKEISLGFLLLRKKCAVWHDLRQRLLQHWWRHWLTSIDLKPECSPWSSNCEVGLHHPFVISSPEPGRHSLQWPAIWNVCCYKPAAPVPSRGSPKPPDWVGPQPAVFHGCPPKPACGCWSTVEEVKRKIFSHPLHMWLIKVRPP